MGLLNFRRKQSGPEAAQPLDDPFSKDIPPSAPASQQPPDPQVPPAQDGMPPPPPGDPLVNGGVPEQAAPSQVPSAPPVSPQSPPGDVPPSPFSAPANEPLAPPPDQPSVPDAVPAQAPASVPLDEPQPPAPDGQQPLAPPVSQEPLSQPTPPSSEQQPSMAPPVDFSSELTPEAAQEGFEVPDVGLQEDASQQAPPLPQEPQAPPAPAAVSEPVMDTAPVEESRVVTQRGRGTDIYVEKRTYQQVLLSVADVQDDLREANDHLSRVLDDENIISSQVDSWHDLLEDVQQNLIAIDMRLFEQGDDDG